MHSNTRDRGARALDTGNVVEYLQSRGVIEPGPADVELLGGGVSNLVLAVRTHTGRVVVKQALSRLRVVEDWFADPGRVLAEARALQIAFDVSP
jgi:5-methylthioribose kinase